jgi:3-hydroxymyristoyl/3-hydroxydecanoyl-(acyl carrier protein) dehydratase
MTVIEKVFPRDHPASQGHFPGNPIIPGAVLLSETAHVIAAGIGCAPAPCQVRSAKFLHPVRPGDRVLIRYSRAAGGEIRFNCDVEGKPVLTGQMACSAPPTAK